MVLAIFFVLDFGVVPAKVGLCSAAVTTKNLPTFLLRSIIRTFPLAQLGSLDHLKLAQCLCHLVSRYKHKL